MRNEGCLFEPPPFCLRDSDATIGGLRWNNVHKCEKIGKRVWRSWHFAGAE
jgi:hypothetical protein